MGDQQTVDGYEHLNLKGWPFNIVPSEATAAVWVGRPDAQRGLHLLLRTASRVPASRIVLLWAAYGGGKTHALKHLQLKARERAELLALYTATPEGIRSFLDVYRAIIDAALEAGTLEAAGKDLFGSRGGPGRTDLERALIRVGTLPIDDLQVRTAISWLKAEKVPLKDLRDIGINRRLESTIDGVDCLNELIAVLQRGGKGKVKVLVLLDEIQEIEKLDKRRQTEAIGGLHKVFDRTTEGLTLVLSFTTASQAQVRHIIGDALFDRRGEILTLPPIDVDEGVELIEGLLEFWSIDKAKSPFPFEPAAIRPAVEAIAENSRQSLTPRDVIRGFDNVLREADLDIEEGKIKQVNAAYALKRVAPASDQEGEDEQA
jgi:hypothetical protein